MENNLNKIRYCYHCHTKYCNHATMTTEQIIQLAITEGYEEIGISEHVPYPNNEQSPYYRLKIEQMDEYLEQGQLLKQKYQNKIKVFIGFESEFFVTTQDWYQHLAKHPSIDYLIFGNHAYPDENNSAFKIGIPWKENKIDQKLEIYCASSIAAIQSGLFKYFCHPDVFMKNMNKWTDKCAEITQRIANVCKELNLPMGFNMTGFMIGQKKFEHGKRYIYPHKEFWEIVSKIQAPVILEPDAHVPFALKQKNLKKLIEYSKQFNLNIVEKIKI